MSWTSFQLAVSSKPTVDFTEQLVTNQGSATVNLNLPTRDPHWMIRAITVVSVQNLAWEFQFFNSADNMGATLDTDGFLGVWQFSPLVVGPPASPGYPIAVDDVSPDSGYYHQYIEGLMMPYWDKDQSLKANPYASVPLGVGPSNANPNNAQIHVRLINRSSTTKNADATGALKATFWCTNQGINA